MTGSSPQPETGASPDERDLWACLAEVPDPEIPVLSIVDLGIVRAVRLRDGGVDVDVAPTYTGCPATEVIEQQVLAALNSFGIADVQVNRVWSPAWTSDWITPVGREKLEACGIAPPAGSADRRTIDRPLGCPRCGSDNTQLISQFGSTACKASYRCNACLEPFEYFKCL